MFFFKIETVSTGQIAVRTSGLHEDVGQRSGGWTFGRHTFSSLDIPLGSYL
jgi:hypothetical protein